MKILIIAQNFYPETGAVPNRMLSFLDAIRDAGYECEIIAAKPNHPQGIIWDDFRGGLISTRTVRGVRVHYTWVYVRPDKGFFKRIIHYVSFMVLAVVTAFKVKRGTDIVLATSPPLFVGAAGWAISCMKSAKFVLDVRDLWPDVAIEMGELRGNTVIRVAKWTERFLYVHADQVIAVTDGFCRFIAEIAANGKKIEKITNGTLSVFLDRPAPNDNPLQDLGLADRFVVTFAGNIGLAQGLDHVIDAAGILQQSHPQVTFLFLGEGIEKPRLEARSNSDALTNVMFHPVVPVEKAADLLISSNALLVPLGNKPIYRTFIPSKLYDSMARGRPVLLSVDGEARSLLDKAAAGIYYHAEDADGLATAVIRLINDTTFASEAGRNGQRYAREHLNRAEQERKLVDLLSKLDRAPALN